MLGVDSVTERASPPAPAPPPKPPKPAPERVADGAAHPNPPPQQTRPAPDPLPAPRARLPPAKDSDRKARTGARIGAGGVVNSQYALWRPQFGLLGLNQKLPAYNIIIII